MKGGIRGLSDPLHASEFLEQLGARDFADPDDLIQLGSGEGFAAQLAMIGDGEPVGFVPDALNEVRGGGVRSEQDGILAAGRKLVFSPRALAGP